MFVCLSVHLFLGYFENKKRWDTFGKVIKVDFCPWEGSRAKIFLIGGIIN